MISAQMPVSFRRPFVVLALVCGCASVSEPDGSPIPAVTPDLLLHEARALERQGKYKEALPVYRRAAEAGNAEAADRVATILDLGLAGFRDYQESLRWRERAAELNPHEKMFELASAIEDRGDVDGAIPIYQSSAEGGNCKAARALRDIYGKKGDQRAQLHYEGLAVQLGARQGRAHLTDRGPYQAVLICPF
jgi:TPR repeat protein